MEPLAATDWGCAWLAGGPMSRALWYRGTSLIRPHTSFRCRMPAIPHTSHRHRYEASVRGHPGAITFENGVTSVGLTDFSQVATQSFWQKNVSLGGGSGYICWLTSYLIPSPHTCHTAYLIPSQV